jgi:hypothetical protein
MSFPASTMSGACALPDPGQSALQAASERLAEGSSCTLSMQGLTWDLIVATGFPNEHVLEYGSQAIYDPVRKKVRYLGGPHSGKMKCLEYDEATNQWGECPLPDGAAYGHGWDHNTVDPATGDHYILRYLTNSFRRWDGARWNPIANDDQCLFGYEEPAIGLTWDSRRGALVDFSDSGGVCLWTKAADKWRRLGKPSGVTASYHFTARFHPPSGLIWLTDGNNGSLNHWKVDTDDRIRALSPAPLNLGCCGQGGVLSTYDYRSGKMIVVHPSSNRWFQYDIVNDSWQQFENPLKLSDDIYIEGIVASIERYGTILYVMSRPTGHTPQAFLYKHRR